jgi:ankyrin repeat protein
VRALLAAHADVNCRDRWNHTPLDEATRGGHQAVIEMLQENGGRKVGGAEMPPRVPK